MGAEGGIIICEIKEIKEQWPKIKKEILQTLDRKGNSSYVWNKEDYIEKMPEIQGLKGDISDMSKKEVFDFLREFISKYDTPYLFGDFIIFADGDNISDINNSMSNCFPGEYIQTWS